MTKGEAKFFLRTGTLVVCTIDNPDYQEFLHVGSVGTVAGSSEDRLRPIAVDWDDILYEGHDCAGRTRPKHGWWMKPEWIELYKEEPKECESPCSDADIISFIFG